MTKIIISQSDYNRAQINGCRCVACIEFEEAQEIIRLKSQPGQFIEDLGGKLYEQAPERIGTAAERKSVPLCTGVLDYFPDALLEVAKLSKVGNDQHNPGEPLHWARGKSGDECDALMRHLIDRGAIDSDGVRHSAKLAWRALANLQKELEEAGVCLISRGSKPA